MRWLLPLLLLPNLLAAQEVKPVVRASLSTEEVRVGAPATLTVTVLVPTWFPKPPVFPGFELPNAIVRLPPDSSYPTSERVGGETWSGIVRNYQVFPLLPATYVLSGITLRVTWADLPRDPEVATVAVPEVTFRGVVPAGAEGLNPYLAGRSLELQRRIEGELDGLEVGDALVLEYVAELEGLPAMFLPSIVTPAKRPGVAIHADEPRIEDGTVARRTERITMIFELGGGYVLPGARLRWFDTDSGEIRIAEVPSMTVEVAGPVPGDGETTNEPGRGSRWSAAVWVLVAALAVPAAGFAFRWLARRLASWHRRRRASEAWAFGQLRRAAGAGDADRLWIELDTWLLRLGTGAGPLAFARRWGDEDLVASLAAMDRARYGPTGGPLRPDRIAEGLGRARRRYLGAHRNSERQRAALPTLNP